MEFIGGYKMELYGMSNIKDLEGFLSVVFNDFCLKNILILFLLWIN